MIGHFIGIIMPRMYKRGQTFPSLLSERPAKRSTEISKRFLDTFLSESIVFNPGTNGEFFRSVFEEYDHTMEY